jgi:hypothetical protein
LNVFAQELPSGARVAILMMRSFSAPLADGRKRREVNKINPKILIAARLSIFFLLFKIFLNAGE